jgi:hypothetical protein
LWRTVGWMRYVHLKFLLITPILTIFDSCALHK